MINYSSELVICVCMSVCVGVCVCILHVSDDLREADTFTG